SIMVIRPWSTMCNDRIEKRSTSLGEMTFYWATNIKTHGIYMKLTNSYKLVNFNVVVIMI
ncbi:hypothetical protein OE319_15150, partial [Bacillus cereus]|nr:hypothetical protein [Bacillus cereus]